MKLNKDVIKKMSRHALSEYPFECCGIVTGRGNEQYIHPCKNIQNRLHAEDPASYPRNARTAYFIERSEFDRVVTAAKAKGEDVLALYHSHTEHEAYFSEEDHAAQTVFGEPEFPEALHVVVSVMNRKVHDIKCFRWNEAMKNFVVQEECC